MQHELPGVPRRIGGTVDYADGAEEELLGVIAGVSDRSSRSDELATHIHDWPTRYHLSRLRSNLLRPLRIPLKQDYRSTIPGRCVPRTFWIEDKPFRDGAACSPDSDYKEECAYFGTPCLIHRERTERELGLRANVVLSRMSLEVVRSILDNGRLSH